MNNQDPQSTPPAAKIPYLYRPRATSNNRMSKPPKLSPVVQTFKELRQRHQLANCVLIGELEWDALRREQEAIGVDISTSEHLTYYGLRVIRVARTSYLHVATEY
jgi:hypothetical protein